MLQGGGRTAVPLEPVLRDGDERPTPCRREESGCTPIGVRIGLASQGPRREKERTCFQSRHLLGLLNRLPAARQALLKVVAS